MNVGYCKKCQNVEDYSEGKVCSQCGDMLFDLGVTIEEWNSMSDSEMIDCVERVNKKKTIKQAPSILKAKKDVSLVSGICPQCGGKIKVDKTQEAAVCEHCGTPFIVEKAINIVNNNIQMAAGEDLDEFVDKIKDRDATLASRISKAIPYFKRYFEYYQKIQSVQEERENYKYMSGGGLLFFYILGYVFVAATLGFIIMLFVNLDEITEWGIAFPIALFPCVIGVPCLAYAFYKRRKMLRLVAECDDELPKLAEKASECYDQISSMLPELPQEYYYPAAVTYIDNIFKSNRADNMRQALAMLDEQIHRWKMEAMAQQNLIIQQQQTAALNALWWQAFLNS